MDGRTDGQTDSPSYRDAFLIDASKNFRKDRNPVQLGTVVLVAWEREGREIKCHFTATG